jgi:hypothetical protein
MMFLTEGRRVVSRVVGPRPRPSCTCPPIIAEPIVLASRPRLRSFIRDFPDVRRSHRPRPRPALLDTYWSCAECPCPEDNRRDWGVQYARRPFERLDRPPTARSSTCPPTSRRTIPVLLGCTSLPPDRDGRSSRAQRCSQSIDPPQDRREQLPGHATSASWNVTAFAWQTTLAPILISCSRSVVSVQVRTDRGSARCRRTLARF